MKLNIKLYQDSSIYELSSDYELNAEDTNKIIGVICNRIFSFYQKGTNTAKGYVLKATLPIDVRATLNNRLIIDTRDHLYDSFRNTFKISKTSCGSINGSSPCTLI